MANIMFHNKHFTKLFQMFASKRKQTDSQSVRRSADTHRHQTERQAAMTAGISTVTFLLILKPDGTHTQTHRHTHTHTDTHTQRSPLFVCPPQMQTHAHTQLSN